MTYFSFFISVFKSNNTAKGDKHLNMAICASLEHTTPVPCWVSRGVSDPQSHFHVLSVHQELDCVSSGVQLARCVPEV